MRRAVVAVVFVVVFAALSISSYTRKSLAIDEGSHVFEGFVILTAKDGCQIQADRPPLMNMWAALPLLIQGVRFDSSNTPRDNFHHAFFFEQNDCDRILRGARLMITVLGILMGLFLFSWAYELFGFCPALVGLVLYSFEPNILCNSGVVTQDIGLTCFFFGAIYFLWRTMREITVLNLVGLSLCFALTLVTKFPGFLLVFLTLVLLAVHVASNRIWPVALRSPRALTTRASKAVMAVGLVFFLLLVWFAVVWATYGFEYEGLSELCGPRTEFYTEEKVVQQMPRLAAVIGWIDRHHLLPNGYSQSFLRGVYNASHSKFAVYLAGQTKFGGWWYYFPFVFLVKTPLTLLLCFFTGLICLGVRWKRFGLNEFCLVLPLFAYLAMSMRSDLNLGVRYVLPIYPFVILVATVAITELVWRRKIWAVVMLCLLSGLEMATVYPHYRAFFNIAAGGPGNGHKLLVDSNIDWGQDLKLLKSWMDRNGVAHVNLAYWGVGDPAYYGIDYAYLPSTIKYAPQQPSAPRLPGFVAVSVNLLHDPAFPEIRSFYEPLLSRTPQAVIGFSIHVYRIE